MKRKTFQHFFGKDSYCIYRKILLFVLCLSIGSFALSTHAQTQQGRTVKGVVSSNLGDVLPGATITVTGTNTATMTDTDGQFSIQVPAGKNQLTISLIGTKSQTLAIGSNNELKVILEDTTINLEEIVAVGYGTMQKKDLSGSITNISEKDFNKGVVSSPEQLIKGQISGLVITQPGGDPTQEATMRLRGSTSLMGGNAPLVVIDGVPGASMNTIAAQDIESMSVLKDASAAAIYGARSANGVIIITTKKGKAGKSTISYNGYFGVENRSKHLDLLSASEWRQWVKDNPPAPGENAPKDYGASTDWQKEILQTGYSQNHNLSLTGGTTTSNYRASINYLDQKGVVLTSEMQRLNANIAFVQKALDDKLTITMNANGTIQDYVKVPELVFAMVAEVSPTMPVYKDDGDYYEIPGYLNYNPLAMLRQRESDNKLVQFQGRMQVDYNFLDMFTASVSGSSRRSNVLSGLYNPRASREGEDKKGVAIRETTTRYSNLFESTLTFDKTFDKIHKVNIIAGYSYQDFVSEYFKAQNHGFITDVFGYNNLAAGEDYKVDNGVASNKSKNKLISFYTRANYSLAGKYIATATIRRDGSTKFGKNHKWGTFPSASIAWRITEEDFMKSLSFADDLKLRVSYGITGNEGIDSYTSMFLYHKDGNYWDDGKFNGAYVPKQNANPDLKWEQTAQFDFGLDYYLFKGKLRGSIDYYVKTTSDLLYNYPVPVPPYQYGIMMANVGKVENKGIEISAETTIIDRKDLKWNLGINFAKNKNVLKEFSNDKFHLDYALLGRWSLNGLEEPPIILKPGTPIGTFSGAKYTGKDDKGIFQYEDVDKSGKFDFETDRTEIGCAQPDFTLNMTNSFEYKNFSLSFMFRGVFGNDIINSTKLYLDNVKRLNTANALNSSLDKTPQDLVLSSYYVEDGSFVRLEYLTLAYDFKLSPTSKIKNLRLSATANNLFVITDYSGLDPEINADGLLQGIDARNYYPKTRAFSIGLNVSF